MSTRREFLLRLFQILDERGVRFCVLRNFDEVFADTASDVDLLADDASVENVRRACHDAAAETSHRLVQQTRFVNHSWVFWDGASSFVRIDVDTEIRWRICHVLTAEEVLAERMRHDEFYIPSPRHEIAILRTQIAWRGAPSERYARRLAELGEPPADAATVRRDIVRNVLRHWMSTWRVVSYFARDLRRALDRAWAPPGACLTVLTRQKVDPEPVFAAVSELFPTAKRAISFDSHVPFRCLFRGGLAINVEDSTAQVAPARAWWPPPERSFIGLIENDGRTHVAHVGSGGMATLPAWVDSARFLAEALARAHEVVTIARQPGCCVALAGLDGSGKTTFARHLCGEVQRDTRFTEVRYFHWIPSVLTNGRESPWPASRETVRKSAPPSNAVNVLLSGLRLLKNIVLANLAWHLRIRPIVRRGGLVLLDRFIFNYWLDPVSVRYVGPANWLETARRWLPKPDWLVTLNADADTLLARKGELTRDQITEQTRRLRELPALTLRQLHLDARREASALAAEAYQTLAAANTSSSELAQLFTERDAQRVPALPLRVLRKGGDPLLLVPAVRPLATAALSLYPAQTARARILRALLLTAWRLGVPVLRERIDLPYSPESALVRWMMELTGAKHAPTLAILCGNPRAAGRRHVVLPLADSEPLGIVVKIGVSPVARELIAAEADFLADAGSSWRGLPGFRGRLEDERFHSLALDFVPGDSPRRMTPERLGEFLTGWIDESRTVPLDQLPAWQRLRAVAALPTAIEQCSERTVHPALSHGDFAPWNIKAAPGGGAWTALDWERGELSGIPGWDWFHFLVQSAVLVEKCDASSARARLHALLSESSFTAYAHRAGIDGIESALADAYLLYCARVLMPSEGTAVFQALAEAVAR
jgi:thymidylate kinase